MDGRVSLPLHGVYMLPIEPCAFFCQGTQGEWRQAAVHEPTGVKGGGLSDKELRRVTGEMTGMEWKPRHTSL